MRYLVVLPMVGTYEFGTEADADAALQMARALRKLDGWKVPIPELSELDGSAGEGCGD